MAIGRAGAASAFLVTAFAASAPAQGNVWVVSPMPGPGVDFVQIGDAVHSAATGDVVLVRSGNYVPLTIAGTSLAVVSDAGAQVDVVAGGLSQSLPVRVDGLGAGADHWIVLQGLSIDGSYPSYSYVTPLQLAESAGSIWIDRCAVKAGNKPAFSGYATGEHALSIRDCASAVLARCTVRGGNGGKGDDWGDAGTGGSGILATESLVATFDSSVWGGSGGFEPVYVYYEPSGGDALRLASATAFASNVRFTGGTGGNSQCAGGPGGDGVELGAASFGSFAACVSNGGAGGAPTGGCGAPGAAGSDFVDAGGSHVLHPGPPRTLAFESPLREGQFSVVTVTGTPGELVILLVSSQPGHFEHPAVIGPVLVALPASSIPLGAIPAGGSTSVGFTVQELGAGVESALVFLQPVLIGASGSIAVGTPAPLVLLDAAL